jgi:hypothetical protein
VINNLPADHYGRFARDCNTCGEFRQPEDFSINVHKNMACGYQVCNSCKLCEKTRKLDSHLKNTYGLSLAEFNQMNEEQKGVCYLCHRPPSGKSERLVVDHCHNTGEVRKLLCVTCNVQLSKFERNEHFVQRIIDYLDLPYERKY